MTSILTSFSFFPFDEEEFDSSVDEVSADDLDLDSDSDEDLDDLDWMASISIPGGFPLFWGFGLPLFSSFRESDVGSLLSRFEDVEEDEPGADAEPEVEPDVEPDPDSDSDSDDVYEEEDDSESSFLGGIFFSLI